MIVNESAVRLQLTAQYKLRAVFNGDGFESRQGGSACELREKASVAMSV
jgi:hypothetical protein